jgi:phosphoenolpyruvate synthase/pyruvate phosphate dikinase
MPEATNQAPLVVELARLLDVQALGFHVPEGYALTTAAFDAVLGGFASGEPQVRSRWPPRLQQEFAEHHARLVESSGSRTFVVRSSAVAEDLPGASFAGQYESYLGVSGLDDVRTAVVRCWASLIAPRVRAYRRAQGLEGPVRGAVAVMPQIRADIAGVAFSVDPLRGSRERVVLELGRETPASVSEGRGRPTQLELDKRDGRVLRTTGAADCLDPGEIAFLLRHIVRLELALEHPVDVEWGLLRRAREPLLVIFQVRPITALPAGPPTWDPGRYAKRFADLS